MAGKPIFDPTQAGRPLQGGRLHVRLGHQRDQSSWKPRKPSYEVAFIFSDTAGDKCRGQEIARRFDLPYFAYDVRRYHQKRGLKRSVGTDEGLAARRAYDQVAARLVNGL